MDRFHEIPEGAVVLRTKGVFRQSKVFRLLQHGGTSIPTTHWLDIDADGVTQPRGRGPTWEGEQ